MTTPTLECYRRRRPQARPGQGRTPGPAQGGLPAIIITVTAHGGQPAYAQCAARTGPSSSSGPPKTAGRAVTHLTSSPSSAPARRSSTAASSNDPRNRQPLSSCFIVGSSRGAVPPLPATRFPGSQLRTRRARRQRNGLSASPRRLRDGCRCVLEQYSQCTASRCSPGTSRPSSHTLAGSLPPFAICPTSRGSDYYEGSATPERHQLTASLPTQVGGVGSFPRSSLADRRGRCPAESRQPRIGTPQPSRWPPARPCAPRSESPTSTCRRACAASRPTSARFGAGRQLTGRQHWFLALHLLVWQYRPVPSLSGLLPPPPAPPGSGCPSFTGLLRQAGGGVLHLHSVKRNLVAHHRS
jgi:hypothetical protein